MENTAVLSADITKTEKCENNLTRFKGPAARLRLYFISFACCLFLILLAAPVSITKSTTAEPPEPVTLKGLSLVKRELTLNFNDTVHADFWKVYINNELRDSQKTKSGEAKAFSVNFEYTAGTGVIKIVSERGYSKVLPLSLYFNDKSAYTVDIAGGYEPDIPEIIMQNPELPNGCEATSLAMLLNAMNINTDKFEAAEAMPTQDFYTDSGGTLYAPNPEKFYAGRPESKSRGFYAFTPPVIHAANTILSKNGSYLKAMDLSKKDFSSISRLIKSNLPIMMWVTIDYGKLRYCENFTWLLSDTNEVYLPVANLHCVVVCGEENGEYNVYDPIRGLIKLPEEKLKYVYEQMGQRAVCIG